MRHFVRGVVRTTMSTPPLTDHRSSRGGASTRRLTSSIVLGGSRRLVLDSTGVRKMGSEVRCPAARTARQTCDGHEQGYRTRVAFLEREREGAGCSAEYDAYRQP